MKWEEYRKLSLEDRDEWRFRFEKKTEQPKPSITLFICIYSLIVMQLLVSVTIYLVPSLTPILPKVDSILDATTQLVKVSLTVILSLYVIEYGTWIYHKNKEKKWVKKKFSSL